MNMQNRLRSKGAWIAIAALVGFLLGNYGLYDAIGLTNESYQMMVDLVLGVAVALGVFNNPTDSTGF
jgi:uncharacterized membrane protein